MIPPRLAFLHVVAVNLICWLNIQRTSGPFHPPVLQNFLSFFPSFFSFFFCISWSINIDSRAKLYNWIVPICDLHLLLIWMKCFMLLEFISCWRQIYRLNARLCCLHVKCFHCFRMIVLGHAHWLTVRINFTGNKMVLLEGFKLSPLWAFDTHLWNVHILCNAIFQKPYNVFLQNLIMQSLILCMERYFKFVVDGVETRLSYKKYTSHLEMSKMYV